jgi:drug/metabolite transporter (DMT)-like permease
MTKQTFDDAKLPFFIALIVLILGAISMGASPVFVRHAEIDSFASAFWRVSLALPGLAIWAYLENRSKIKPKLQSAQPVNFKLAIILTGTFFAGDLIFWHLSIQYTTIANATLLSCLAPIWVALFSKVIGEPISKNAIVGLGFCLIGAFALVGANFQLAPEHLIGDIYGMITSIFFGLYFLGIRVARRSYHGAGTITFFSTIVTSLILGLFMLAISASYWPETSKSVAALFSLAYISQIGGQGLLTIALGSLSATFSSLVIFIEAIAAALLGWLIEDEPLHWMQLIGGSLILLGIYIARPR